MPKPLYFRFRFAQFVNGWRTLRADRRGTVAVLMGLLMPILVASLGIGFEISSWYMQGRSMQNAADAAATAAASNNGPGYDAEAKAVAARYGYVHGSNNVTVSASNSATCPTGGNDCYSVTITNIVPLYLAQVIGFAGDNGSGQKLISSTAIAQNETINVPICLLALEQGGGDAIRTNGAPNSDLSGCTVMSNSDSDCNGSDLQAAWGLAAGTNTDCGINQRSNVPVVNDPYEYLKTNIPANPCTTYSGVHLPAMNPMILDGTAGLLTPVPGPGNIYYACGDVVLDGNVTIKTPDDQIGATLVVYNGKLDVRNRTLKVGSDSGLTIVFSGDNGRDHYPDDSSNAPGGVFDISSPKGSSAPFPGLAIYQDPRVNNNVDFDIRGSDPQWFISGGVYLPNANPRVRGNVSPATNGEDCFVLVTNTVRFDGTMNLYQQTPDGSGCNLQGLTQPSATIDDRGHLVF